jgi:hypothetical protein
MCCIMSCIIEMRVKEEARVWRSLFHATKLFQFHLQNERLFLLFSFYLEASFVSLLRTFLCCELKNSRETLRWYLNERICHRQALWLATDSFPLFLNLPLLWESERKFFFRLNLVLMNSPLLVKDEKDRKRDDHLCQCALKRRWGVMGSKHWEILPRREV